jgi:UDP-N-acetylglucosamine:LPS N-acetylglucosamine transferase
MIVQADLSAEKLAGELKVLVSDRIQLAEMGAAASNLARPDAAAATADLIEKLNRK